MLLLGSCQDSIYYLCIMKKKVVVGLSGGVDSSVAAYLLQEQGYEVIALFMKNWHDETVTLSNECPWLEDSNDAMIVADKLGIPFQTVDLSVEYKDRIVDYMFAEYQKGRTPNPDVLCNREIKFDVFSGHREKVQNWQRRPTNTRGARPVKFLLLSLFS